MKHIANAYTDAGQFPMCVTDKLDTGFSEAQKNQLILQLIKHQHRPYRLGAMPEWKLVETASLENLQVESGVMRPEIMTSRYFAEFLFDNPSLYEGADVIDVGAGCGIQGITIARRSQKLGPSGVKRLAFCDIDAGAVMNCRNNVQNLLGFDYPVVRGDFAEALKQIREQGGGWEDFGNTPRGLVVVFNQPFFSGTQCPLPEAHAVDPNSVLMRAWNSMVMSDDMLKTLFDQIQKEHARAIMPFCYFNNRNNRIYEEWNDPSLIADGCNMKVFVLDSVHAEQCVCAGDSNDGAFEGQADGTDRTDYFLQEGRVRFYLFEPKNSRQSNLIGQAAGNDRPRPEVGCWSCQYAESGRRRSGNFHKSNYGARIDDVFSSPTTVGDILTWLEPTADKARHTSANTSPQQLLSQEVSDNVFLNLAWHTFSQFARVKAVLAIYTVSESDGSDIGITRIPSDMIVRCSDRNWHNAQVKYADYIGKVSFDMTGKILSSITVGHSDPSEPVGLTAVPFLIQINSRTSCGAADFKVTRCTGPLAKVYTDEVVISIPQVFNNDDSVAGSGMARIQETMKGLDEQKLAGGTREVIQWLMNNKDGIANGYLPMVWEQIKALANKTGDLFMYLLPLCTGSQKDTIPVGSVFLWCEDELKPSDILAAVCISENVLSPIRIQQIRAESIRHATKAAFGAIASRNLSHNFGSHVIPALTKYEWPVGSQAARTEIAAKAETVFGDNDCFRDFLQYLQTRMDFISRLTSDWPASRQPLDIVDDVLLEWAKQRWLIDNIVRDNGYSTNTMTISLRIRGVNAMQGVAEYKLYPDLKLTPGASPVGVMAGINGGTVGAHAIYAILENLIRNTAKHSSNPSEQGNKLNITITVEPDKTLDGYLRISYVDNLTPSSAQGKILEAIHSDVTDPHTLRVNENAWGYKEIRLAAEYLVYPARYRPKCTPQDNKSQASTSAPVFLTDEDGHCAVSFRVPVAKMVTFICGEDILPPNAPGHVIQEKRFTAMKGYSAHRVSELRSWLDERNKIANIPPPSFSTETEMVVFVGRHDQISEAAAALGSLRRGPKVLSVVTNSEPTAGTALTKDGLPDETGPERNPTVRQNHSPTNGNEQRQLNALERKLNLEKSKDRNPLETLGLSIDWLKSLIRGELNLAEVRKFAAVCRWIRHTSERGFDPLDRFDVYVANDGRQTIEVQHLPLNLWVHRTGVQSIGDTLMCATDPDRIAVIDDHFGVGAILKTQPELSRRATDFVIHSGSSKQKSMLQISRDIMDNIWVASSFATNSPRKILVLDERIWDATYELKYRPGLNILETSDIGELMAWSGIVVPLIWTNNEREVLGPARRNSGRPEDQAVNFKPVAIDGFCLGETRSDVALAVKSGRNDNHTYSIDFQRVTVDEQGLGRLADFQNLSTKPFSVAIVHQGLLHSFVRGEDSSSFLDALKTVADKVVLTSGGGRADIWFSDKKTKPLFLEFGTLQRCLIHDLCKHDLLEAVDSLK